MRWFWIDRFVEFEQARRAVAEKAVALGEEQVDGYMPGFPIMPHSLMIEGLAQTGGIIVSEHYRFQRPVVLAKVAKARFHGVVHPGDVLTYSVNVESLQRDGALVTGAARVGQRLQVEAELFFACLDEGFERGDLFEPYDLLCMLRVLRLFEVGRKEDGSPLDVPDHMREAEQAVMGC